MMLIGQLLIVYFFFVSRINCVDSLMFWILFWKQYSKIHTLYHLLNYVNRKFTQKYIKSKNQLDGKYTIVQIPSVVFSCEFSKMLKNNFFTKHFLMTITESVTPCTVWKVSKYWVFFWSVFSYFRLNSCITDLKKKLIFIVS